MKTITSSVAFQGPDGAVAANGRLLLSLSQNAMITSGGGQVYSLVPVVIDLDANGLIPAGTTIWANDELTPSGTTYLVNLQDRNRGRLDTLGTWSISGASPIDLSGMTPSSAAPSFPFPVLLAPVGNQTVVQPSGTNLLVNRFENIRFADQFATGSSTGGIQEAINDLGTNGGTIVLPRGTTNITSTIVIGGAVKQNSIRLIGHAISATFMGTSLGSRIAWVGAANGTVLRIKSTSLSYFADFTIDGNSSAGIGIEYTATNAIGFSILNTFERIVVENCSGTPGYGWYVGSAANDEVANTQWRDLTVSGNVHGWYQEGTNTVDIYVEGFQDNLSTSNGMNIRAGSITLKSYTGSSSSAVNIRINPTTEWAYLEDLEIETVNTQSLLIEADAAASPRTYVIRNSRWAYSGAVNGELFNIGASCQLILDSLKLESFINAAFITLSPAHGTIFLTENNVFLSSAVLVSRNYTFGKIIGGSIGSSDGAGGCGNQFWITGSGSYLKCNLLTNPTGVLSTNDSSGNGWQITAGTSTSAQFMFWKYNSGATQFAWDMQKGNVQITENTAPSGSAGVDLLWADSTAHRLKMNNNNGGALTVAATSGDTFTNTALGGTGSTTPDTTINRLKANRGTALVSGDFALSAGWGSTAALSAIAGTDTGFTVTVTANGAGIAANPTLTLTYKDGTWTNAPVFTVTRGDGNAPTTGFWIVQAASTATAAITQFVGLPVAGNAYTIYVIVVGH